MTGRIVDVVAKEPIFPPESSPVIASRVPPKDVLFQLRPQEEGIAVSGGGTSQPIFNLCNDMITLNGAVMVVGTVCPRTEQVICKLNGTGIASESGS
jgi:hypothetical protein